jgi:hypothetical protein
MATPPRTSSPLAVPGFTAPAGEAPSEVWREARERLEADQRQVDQQRSKRAAEKAAAVAAVPVPPPAATDSDPLADDEDDGDIADDAAENTQAYLDRYLAPVRAAAPGMTDAWVAANRRDLPQPIVSLTPEQIGEERAAAATAFDFYRSAYDAVDGDTEKLRAQILSKSAPGIDALAGDKKAFEALVDLADQETKPYSWFTRAAGTFGDADFEESAARTKEEFTAGRAARAVTLGPKQRRFKELTTVFTPGALPEIDITDTQAELIEDYRVKYATDAQLDGRELTADDWREIEGKAIDSATQDIRHAMSSIGRPIVFSMGASKTPLEMQIENDRATGTDRVLDSTGASIMEAKLRWKKAELPTEAGSVDSALIQGGNAAGLLGQLLMAIDPTEIVGTSLDVAAKEYRRSLAAAEEDGEVADSGDVLLSAAKGAVAGGYANALQMFPLFPYDEALAAAGAAGVVPEAANEWREQVVRDTIISSGDNEDYFDTVTDALPTFTAAGWRAATGEENTAAMKKWFLENQFAAKSALMLVAIKTPMLPVTSALGPVGDLVTGAARARRIPTDIATTIEQGIEAGLDATTVARNVDNAYGVGPGGAVQAVAISAAANAAERDVDLLTREVSQIVSRVQGPVDAARVASEEAAAAAARAARTTAVEGSLTAAKLDDAAVAPIRSDLDTEELRRLIDPQADPTQPSKMADAISDWAAAVAGPQRTSDDLLQTTDLMDKALAHTAKVREAVYDVARGAQSQLDAAEASLTPTVIASITDITRAEKALARAMTRLSDLRTTVTGADDILDGVISLARAKKNEAALRLRLKRVREGGGNLYESRSRSAVEAEIAALEGNTTKTRQEYAYLAHLKSRVAATPQGAADIRLFSTDAHVVMGMIRNNRKHIERGQAALEALKTKNPKAYATAEGIISDMQAPARVLSDTDKLAAAANGKLLQRQAANLRKQQGNLINVVKKLDAVDAHIALKTRAKYPTSVRPLKALKGSAVNEIELRRAEALRRANAIARRRAVNAAGTDQQARVAAEAAWNAQAKEVQKASRAAVSAARTAAASRLVVRQREALVEFAAALRRGAAETARRKINTRSMTYRTGLPDRDLRIIDHAKDELTRRLGASDVFGNAVGTKQEYIDHVVASVLRVADDIGKDLDPDDLRRVIDEVSPATVVDFATLGTAAGRRAALENLTRSLAEIQHAGFSAVGDVKMEHLHQAVTEAVGVALQTRRAERDVFAALTMQQSAWARQGFRYALYKMMTPRAGFIGEGSDQAWRVYQHADQVSAGLQAWLVVQSQRAIDDLMKTGGQYTRKELADRLLTTLSEAFATVGDKARLGLPVDTLSPFQVAKRFLMERSPSAHASTVTPTGGAVRDTTKVAEVVEAVRAAKTAQEKAVRAHAGNQVVDGRRARSVTSDAEILARKQAELDARNAEATGNATQAAEARARKVELEADRVAAEKTLSPLPQDIIDDAVRVEEEALAKLNAEKAATKAKLAQADKDVKAAAQAGAPKRTPADRAKSAAEIKELERQLTPEKIAERQAQAQAMWEATKARKAGKLFEGKQAPAPKEVKDYVTQRLAEGADPATVLYEAAQLPGVRWAASTYVRRMFHPDVSLMSNGGLASQHLDTLRQALKNLENFEADEAWKTSVGRRRETGNIKPTADEPWRFSDAETVNSARRMQAIEAASLEFQDALNAPQNIKEARIVIRNLIKRGEKYQKDAQERITQGLAQIIEVQGQAAKTSDAFLDSDIFKAFEQQLVKERAAVLAKKAELAAEVGGNKAGAAAAQAVRAQLTADQKALLGRITSQTAKVKAAKSGKVATPAAADYIRSVKDKIATIDDDIKSINAQIGTFDRFSSVDVATLEAEILRLSKSLKDKQDAAQIASQRSAASRKALEDATTTLRTKQGELTQIENAAASLTRSDLVGAINEGALDEKTMTIFDKIVLNMGRSVFRGMQATGLDEDTLNRILYTVARDALAKSDDFKTLHERIKKGLLGRLPGELRIIDDRAPRTATALSAALMQAVTAEYTTQYALREGLAIVQKTEAMGFNALLSRPIANSMNNSTTVIRDMYSTLEQVLRTGARLGRVNEGRSTLPIFDRRGDVSLELVEAAKLPGFNGGVWLPESVLRTALEDLEAYARQMDVLSATAPAEIGSWIADKAKDLFSMWRTKVLVGYGINFGTYRTRAVTGDIASTYMVFGAKEAAKVAAMSTANVLPFVREGAIDKLGALGALSNKAVASLAATTAAWRNGTVASKLLSPGTWQYLPRRVSAAILDSVAEVPKALAGITSPHVGRMLRGEMDEVLRLGDTEQTVEQWWNEARREGILDNNVEINLRTALRRGSEMWAEVTSRRHSWAAVELEYFKQKKGNPSVTRESVRQSMEASESVKTVARTTRIKHALLRHQETLEKTEAQVHVTTRITLYTSLRKQGLTAKEAADGVKAAIYDWNYGANRAVLNMLSFVPFGRFHVLRKQQGVDMLNMASDTSPWRKMGGGAIAPLRRAALLERYMASSTQSEIPSEEELDIHLADARAYGANMADEWGMTPQEAAVAAEQETLSFLISAWWARAHSPDYLSNRQYFYDMIPAEQQEAFKKAYGSDPGTTLAMTSRMPQLSVWDAFEVISTGAALAEVTFATLNGEDVVAANAMSKLTKPWIDLLPDPAKAILAVFAGKAGAEMDAIEQGRHTPQMLAAATPAEADIMNALGYAPVTFGLSDSPIRSLLTTTKEGDARPRAGGMWSKSLLAAIRLDPVISPALTKTINASAYKNPQYGKDWDAVRAAYTFSNLVGATSYGVTDPLREATFDVLDVKAALTKKKQTASGASRQGARAAEEQEP